MRVIPKAKFRLDINGGWQLEEAVANLTNYDKEFPGQIDYVEQPCIDLADIKSLRGKVNLKIAVDESIRKFLGSDLTKIREVADIAIIKWAPSGGISASLEIIEKIKLPVVISSALESSVGISHGVALASSADAKAAVSRAGIVAKYTYLVRDLINTPPSHLTPDSFTKKLSAAVKAAGGTKAGLKIQIWDEKQLKTQGFGGIIGVGQGSANPPRLLHISYTPKGKAAKRYAFVGKGITFDTGGLALKPAAGMEAMKSDMSGAQLTIDVRGRDSQCEVVKLPFVTSHVR